MALYGGSTASAALIITLLGRSASANYPDQPEHLGIASYLILSLGAIAFGALISGLWTYLVSRGTNRPRSIVLWLVFGFAFGIVLPVLTGFTIPTTTMLLQLANGETLPVGALMGIADAVFRGVPYAFVYGTLGIYTGMIVGSVFGLAAWVIDMVNSSENPRISRYGSLSTSVILSVMGVATAAFGPPALLAKLG